MTKHSFETVAPIFVVCTKLIMPAESFHSYSGAGSGWAPAPDLYHQQPISNMDVSSAAHQPPTTMTVCFAGQQPRTTMAVSIAGQQQLLPGLCPSLANNHQPACLPALRASSQPPPWLFPLLANNHYFHGCIHAWPATNHYHGCLHCLSTAMSSMAVPIAGQQPPTIMAVCIAG